MSCVLAHENILSTEFILSSFSSCNGATLIIIVFSLYTGKQRFSIFVGSLSSQYFYPKICPLTLNWRSRWKTARNCFPAYQMCFSILLVMGILTQINSFLISNHVSFLKRTPLPTRDTLIGRVGLICLAA